MPNKLALLVSAHTEIKKAADDAVTAAQNERAKARTKAKTVATDVVTLRREQYSLTEIARRYGVLDFDLATMTDVEDGINTEPETLERYARLVLEFAKWKGLRDAGAPPLPPWWPRHPDGTPVDPLNPTGTQPPPPPRPINPDDLIAKPVEPIDPTTLMPFIVDGVIPGTSIPRIIPNPRYKPPKTT